MDKNEFCRRECKGFQDIGYCLMDGRCQAYLDYMKSVEINKDKYPCVICDFDKIIGSKHNTLLFDKLNEYIKNHVFVFFVSYTEDKYYDDTLMWLRTNFMEDYRSKMSGIDYKYKLIMKKTGDTRPNDDIKKEMLEKYIHPYFNVTCIL